MKLDSKSTRTASRKRVRAITFLTLASQQLYAASQAAPDSHKAIHTRQI